MKSRGKSYLEMNELENTLSLPVSSTNFLARRCVKSYRSSSRGATRFSHAFRLDRHVTEAACDCATIMVLIVFVT